MAFRGLPLFCLLILLGCQHPHVLQQDLPGQNNQRAAFEMVYVPGDKSAGIESFYIGKTEVTWAMFLGWAHGEDLGPDLNVWTKEYIELTDAGLRPSWVDIKYFNRQRGLTDKPNHPAIGMSRLTARSYCKWVSEQTGRQYRLPSEAQWLYVLERSGGLPKNQAELLKQAVLADNAPKHAESGETLPAAVASKAPNRLGLYDLLGNAAEWIEPADEGRWLRGGHFRLPADVLTDGWRIEEDLDVWMEGWPGLPYSRFWYLSHYFQGIRLVCDVEPSGDKRDAR